MRFTLALLLSGLFAGPALAGESKNNVSAWARALDGSGEAISVSYSEPPPKKGREHMRQEGRISIMHGHPTPCRCPSV
jgi:hypothetical protein